MLEACTNVVEFVNHDRKGKGLERKKKEEIEGN